jgi:hypothetical protein
MPNPIADICNLKLASYKLGFCTIITNVLQNFIRFWCGIYLKALLSIWIYIFQGPLFSEGKVIRLWP